MQARSVTNTRNNSASAKCNPCRAAAVNTKGAAPVTTVSGSDRRTRSASAQLCTPTNSTPAASAATSARRKRNCLSRRT